MSYPHSPQPGGFRPAPPPGGSGPGQPQPGGFRPTPPPGGSRPGQPQPGGFRPGQPQPGGFRPGPPPSQPQAPAAPVERRIVDETGHPAVDAVLRSLENAAQLAPGEQIAAYEAAHQVLQETLSSIEG